MTVTLFVDGAAHYRTFSRKWSVTNAAHGWAIAPGAGRYGTDAIDAHLADTGTIAVNTADHDGNLVTHNAISASMHLFLSGLPPSAIGSPYLLHTLAGTSRRVEFAVEDDGHLSVTVFWSGGSYFARSLTGIFPFNCYTHISYHANFPGGSNAGEFHVFVDETEVEWDVPNTAIDAGGTAFAFRTVTPNKSGESVWSGGVYLLSDYYVTDGAGYGDCGVFSKYPDGAGSYQEFDLGHHNAGSHYTSVQNRDGTFDIASDFVVTYTDDTKETYTFEDLGGDLAANVVQAVQVFPLWASPFFRHRSITQVYHPDPDCDIVPEVEELDDEGFVATSISSPPAWANLLRYAGSDSEGGLIEFPAGFGSTTGSRHRPYDIFDTNPSNGDAAWTYAQVNALQLGVRLDSISVLSAITSRFGHHTDGAPTAMQEEMFDRTSADNERLIRTVTVVTDPNGVCATDAESTVDSDIPDNLSLYQMVLEVLVKMPSRPCKQPQQSFPQLMGQ